jgi:hypothetical protein
MPAIQYELGYLALSRSELNEINNLQEPEQSSYGIDIVMSVSSSEFGRNFRRVCKRARWTLDPAIEKRVRAIIAEASSELATKCASRSDIKMFADLAAAYRKNEKPVSSAAPVNNRNGAAAQMPVTLDQWHRALGFYKCATCGAPIGNGIRYAWQGRNRWCEKCFWGEDSEDAVTKIPAESGAPEKENTDVDH